MNRRFLVYALLCVLYHHSPSSAQENRVSLLKTPSGGIQPQALLDAHGNLHLLYFHGESANGNLFYVRRDAGKSDFTKPMRVNSQENSAIATGTIRGGQLAIGKNGRVNVAWNGSGKAEPRIPNAGMPMLYARQGDKGAAFEPQRNLMTRSAILDGGGSLAADQTGNVYVAWHGISVEGPKGEDNRKVWVSISHDDGKTFAAEKPAWDEPTGACGCCGARGFADLKGEAYFVYRAATNKTDRGMVLLRSMDQGKSFTGARLDKWMIDTCPMSSETFAEGPSGVYAAWENDGQVYFARVGPGRVDKIVPKAAPGKANGRKHPAIAVNKSGELILVWAEGTGWNKGGALAWQVYDAGGNPTAERGVRAGGIPVWSLPAVVAEADGRFTIIH